jgi:glucan phosphoethanolaminetransferase (alkaline phosphatase superfamily)
MQEVIHPSTLIHLLLVGLYVWGLFLIAKNVDASKLSVVSRLIQIALLCFFIDLAIGVFLVESIYGSSRSARWISKSLTFIPMTLAAAFFRMFVVRRAAKRNSTKETTGAASSPTATEASDK